MLFEILAQATVTPTVIPTPTATPYGAMEFFRDQIWQFLGAMITLILFIVGIFLARREKEIKELTPILLANTPLISVREEDALKGRLVITFDGQAIQEPDIYTLLLEFVNTGNKPIGADDFSAPIRIEFGDKVEVLTASVESTQPEKFDATAQPKPDDTTKVLLDPVLLNQKQSVIVKVLVRSASAVKPSIYAHIKGTKVLPLEVYRFVTDFPPGVYPLGMARAMANTTPTPFLLQVLIIGIAILIVVILLAGLVTTFNLVFGFIAGFFSPS